MPASSAPIAARHKQLLALLPPKACPPEGLLFYFSSAPDHKTWPLKQPSLPAVPDALGTDKRRACTFLTSSLSALPLEEPLTLGLLAFQLLLGTPFSYCLELLRASGAPRAEGSSWNRSDGSGTYSQGILYTRTQGLHFPTHSP